jgi:O-antigen ligase
MQSQFQTLTPPRSWTDQPEQLRAHLLIIGVVLLLSIGLPLAASPRYVLLSLGLLLGIISILAFLRWPPLGLVALVYIALMAPSPNLPGGLNTPVLFLGLLVALWLLKMVAHRHIKLVPSRTVQPVLALAGVAILAFGAGQLPWFLWAEQAPLDTQLGALAIFVLAAGAFLLVAHQIHDLKWLEWLTWSYLAVAALAPAGWLLPWLIHGLNDRVLQPGVMNNSMFWLWLVALSCSQALYNQKLHRVWRLALGILCLATMYVVFIPLYDWKSGYLPTVAALGVIVGARSWRIGVLLALVGYIPIQLLSNSAIASDEYSYFSRLDAWLVVLDMVKVSPLLGFGPANYHQYTILFLLRGYHSYFNSHNQYLDIIAQIGFLGLGCFLWFAWEVGRLAWQLRKQAPVGFAQAYVYGVLGGLVGMLVSGMLVDWFLPFVYNIGLTGFRASMLAWVFLGGLVGIERVTHRQVTKLQ